MSLRARATACALLATTALASPAFAQSAPPPKYQSLDENGVDLTSGWVGWSMTEGSIGSGEGALSLARTWAGTGGWTDNWSGRLYKRTSGGVSEMVVELGGISDRFSISGSTYTSLKGDGATLSGTTYTAADGTVIVYSAAGPDLGYAMSGTGCTLADPGTCAIPVSITRPNGMKFTLNWDVLERCFEYDSELNCISGGAYFRWRGVSSSANYSFTVNYVTDTPGSGVPVSNWYKRSGATFTNLASAPSTLPSVSYTLNSSGVPTALTDTGGRSWGFSYATNGHLSGVKRPGVSSDTSTWSYGTNGVSSATIDGVTTSYSVSVSGSTRTTTVTNALSQASSVVADTSKGRVTSVTDPLSRTTSFTYDSSNRLTRTTLPEGNYVQLTYDARGNVAETRRVAKSGTGLSDIVATASFPSSCSSAITCNKPTSTTDARGNTTDYTYDSTHGGLLTATLPAPTSGATRPQTRLSYTQVTAVTGEPVYLLTATSRCQTSSSCSGGSDEAKAVISYETSNLLPVSMSSGNGSGTLTTTSAMTYDSIGNLLTVDGPLSGTADTIRYRFNAARQVVGTISADPDGGGSLKHRAVRNTYDSQGLLTKVEAGTVNSQSDSDWSAMSVIRTSTIGYDANARSTSQTVEAGGTIYALTQTSYDALGRLECGAQRMNPTTFSSPPTSACSLATAGTYGSDRIVRTAYDAAGQATSVKTGYGTSVETTDVTTTYSSNGLAATVNDAETNKTTYEYDGHDRLVKTRFPSTTKGAGTSSTTDYEQYGYDANGNRTSFRNRANETIAYTFDALNRMTAKDLPGTEPDVSYGYDLLGRMTSAAQTGNSLSFTFDALGRNLTQVGPHGTITSTWDVAGRRTRITHPDSNYWDYDYLVTDELFRVRENGATSGVGVLATYNYDTSSNAGQMGIATGITFGNGASTSYTYDAVQRLTTLGLDIGGTTYDQSLGFSYSPASQITQNTRSNDLYAWNGHYNVNRNYTANGLNQYTASGSVTPTYDGKGNLTSAGTTTYSYSSENLLKTASGGVALSYDPAMRLYETAGGTPGTTRREYDGTNLIAEYNGAGSVLRRYVHGAGADVPLVWYEGSGLTTRRFLQGDERLSVTAITDGTATIVGTNTYDEYGIPGSSNVGRFQYTGQTWLPELGMNYYKARVYSPTLGRFLQTDPIGYGDGMNLYGYGDSDPVNSSDPSGLKQKDVQCTGSRLCKNHDSSGGSSGSVAVFGDLGRSGDRVDAYLIEEFDLSNISKTLNSWIEFRVGGFILASFSIGDFAAPCRNQAYDCSQTAIGDQITKQTWKELLSDSTIFRKMLQAMYQSNPWGAPSSKKEHGFWIYEKQGRWMSGPIYSGKGHHIPTITHQIPGAKIFFHTHPFWPGESSVNGLGMDGWDMGIAQRNKILMIAMSHHWKTSGPSWLLHWVDCREPRC